MKTRKLPRLLIAALAIAAGVQGCSAFVTADTLRQCKTCEVYDRYSRGLLYQERVCGRVECRLFMEDFEQTSRRFTATCN